MSIGTCERKASHDPRSEATCGGPLCVSSKMTEQDEGPFDHNTGFRPRTRHTIVACERCGHEHPEHPLLAEDARLAAEQAAKPALAFTIPSTDFGFSDAERLRAAERAIISLQAEVAALRSELTNKGERRAKQGA